MPHKKDEPSIPFQLTDYLELVDWSGRAIRDKKHGYIPNDLPNTLHRLYIDPQAWKRAMQPGGNVFGRAMGQLDQLRLHANSLGQAWVRGQRHSKTLFDRIGSASLNTFNDLITKAQACHVITSDEARLFDKASVSRTDVMDTRKILDVMVTQPRFCIVMLCKQPQI